MATENDQVIGDWDEKKLAGFVTRIINAQTPDSSDTKDVMEVATNLKIMDQLEMSPQGLLYLGERIRTPSARVYNSAPPSIAFTTFTLMPWDTKSHDTTGDEIWKPAVSNTKLNIPVDGLYLCMAGVGWYFGSNNIGSTLIRFTGNWGTTPYRQGMNDGNFVCGAVIVDALRFAKGDYVQVDVYQNGQGSSAQTPTASHNFFTISRIG